MKIGIVNDMPMAVEALRRALTQKPGYQVVWVARNGAEAVEQCAKATPDLVLMDLIMPGMDGVETTRRIMAQTPCAILIVTVSVGANASRVFEAMGQGALDAVDTPAWSESTSPLLAKIETVQRLIRDKNGNHAAIEHARRRGLAPYGENLVAMGASAGGPAALSAVLRGLPRDFPAAIVIIQHVDAQFAAGMAEWLALSCMLPVRVAREGEAPAAGVVLLAATNDHLTLKAPGHLGYTAKPVDYPYRPSVDVFFQSACRFWPGTVVGVLLTGMGRDGALGLKALRNKGHYTMAQDQASSAVYGMPKAAARLDAAVDIVALEQIAPKLVNLFAR
ncbi:chemotaxis response regulator protein-glutamate methylesterase [Aromatoleum diolicum]|uniref:Protein-glutamate methylesterase/protein-glutamine glutaminase n=1 Tax=Aromatoleum diolicum TaxID=75796 RepID=A0ABX1QI74_9RHOO|nr:chemotaxis response regulator protein-glutamate methylesterase [Aromatoleum diolicum]NMG76934.1 chemotaxis-specific protein-glutamate methyltransferase CheB [Aromatoleum diolicum]